MFVFLDVQIFQIQFSLFEEAISITHIGLTQMKGFDFGAFQHNAGLKLLQEVEFMTGFTIDDFQGSEFRTKVIGETENRDQRLGCKAYGDRAYVPKGARTPAWKDKDKRCLLLRLLYLRSGIWY